MSARARRRRLARHAFRVVVSVCFMVATSPLSSRAATTSSESGRASAVNERGVYQAANSATVKIKSMRTGSRKRANGAGVVISADGYILTAHHVVRGYNKIHVSTVGGDVLLAQVILVEEDYDIALLKVRSAKPMQWVPLALGTSQYRNRDVWVIGNPFGMGQSVISGITGGFRTVNWESHRQSLQEVSASVEKGNSGGGTFDRLTGELLGINVAKSATRNETGYMVPSDRLVAILNRKTPIVELVDSEEIDEQMGVRLRQVTLIQCKFDRGMLVTSVRKGSAAWRAGWRVGDVLVGMDRYKMIDQEAVLYVLRDAARNAAEVNFLLARGDDIDRGQIRLGTAPAVAASANSQDSANPSSSEALVKAGF